MILLVHGWNGSGEGHWQRWLLETLHARGIPAEMPDLPDPAEPLRDRWVEVLAERISAASSEVTLICHSLGCWAVDHLIARHDVGPRLRDVLLVAPPSPLLPVAEVETFLPPPLDPERWAPLAQRSEMVCGDDDDYATPNELQALADRIGIPLRVFPGVGHLNPDSGFGPWPWVLEWLEERGAIPAAVG